MSGIRSAAFCIERRSLAVAIFVNGQLDYVQAKQLQSDSPRAAASLAGFLNWVIESFRVESAVLERVESSPEIRRVELTQLTIKLLRDAGIPINEVTKVQLFEAFGVPRLKSRRQVRECVGSIWPILGASRGSAAILDAVALGLVVETERLFIQ